MRADSTPAKIHLPPLCDEAAVEIYDFLCEFLLLFENHYSGQIRRFYAERSRDSLADPEPLAQPENDDSTRNDDPPF